MIDEIISRYNGTVKGLFDENKGGRQRSKKGTSVEDIAKLMIKYAWAEIGGEKQRLSFSPAEGKKKVRIALQEDYIESLPEPIRNEVKEGKEFSYDVGVDVHVYIDGNLVLGVECKAYTENAMLKRILVDFFLLRTRYPNLGCCLLQLETQLGGENNEPGDLRIANRSTPTLMSYFPNVDLNILTLLEGARDVKKPIHKKKHFKEMKPEFVRYAIEQVKELLRPYK